VRLQHEDNILRQVHLVPAGGPGPVLLPDVCRSVKRYGAESRDGLQPACNTRYPLVFYPACFGIQNDADHRILELLFGIPNYMYKVWLFRLFMIYVEVYLILVVYAFLARILLFPVQPFSMALNLMLPVMLFGNLAFLYSTLIRNGSAAAVLSVLSVILVLILGNVPLVENKVWDVTINPYEEPENINAAIWSVILLKNRILMIVAAIIFLMSGLLGLQNRGKFLG